MVRHHAAPARGKRDLADTGAVSGRSFQQELLSVLARIEALLVQNVGAQSGTSYLDRSQVAELLGVSTRWVERHLRPSSQMKRGGRAWFVREDVEAQMRALRPSGPPPPRAQRGTNHAPSIAPEAADKLASIERRLRGEATESEPASPISTRGRCRRGPGR